MSNADVGVRGRPIIISNDFHIFLKQIVFIVFITDLPLHMHRVVVVSVSHVPTLQAGTR